MILTGCATKKPPTPSGPLPDECYRDTPHAAIYEGAEVRSVLKRERHQLDVSNASKRRCTDFYTNITGGGVR